MDTEPTTAQSTAGAVITVLGYAAMLYLVLKPEKPLHQRDEYRLAYAEARADLYESLYRHATKEK